MAGTPAKKDAPAIIEKASAFIHNMQRQAVAGFGIEQAQSNWGERLVSGAVGMAGTVFSVASSTFLCCS